MSAVDEISGSDAVSFIRRCIYLFKVSNTVKEGEIHRHLHLLIRSLDDCQGQGWVRYP